MKDQRIVIVVPAALQAAANRIAEKIDPAGGANTFNVPLTGSVGSEKDPPTHYWCSWALTAGEQERLIAFLEQADYQGKGIRVYNGLTMGAEAILNNLGLKQRVSMDIA